MRYGAGGAQVPWKLLGVHSAHMDVGGRDMRVDESLGLNCAWYADILLAITTEEALGNAPSGLVRYANIS
jgi:hypothetical protein